MNEEKNNIGVNNSGLPPMNAVPMGNTGANNLPPMGSAPTGSMPTQNSQSNNIQDKYGLPPISNFTNFNTSYEVPKVDDNTSVFDLMNQFENVNNNVGFNNQQVVNNTSPVINNTQPVINNANNTIPNTPVLNQSELSTNTVNSIEPLSMFSGSNNVNEVQSFNNVEAVPTQSFTDQIPNGNINQSIASNPLDIFGGNVDNNQANMNTANAVPSINNPIGNTVNEPSVNNVDNTSNMPIPNANIENNNSVDNNAANSINSGSANLNSPNMPGGNIDNNQAYINDISTQNQVAAPIANNMENSTSNPASNSNDVVQNNGLVDNQVSNDSNSSAINIPTMSIDDVVNNSKTVNSNHANNSNSYDDGISELITTFDTNTNTNTNTNALYDSEGNVNVDNTTNTTTNSNTSTTIEKPKKKKKGKLLFIILLIVTILILAAVGVLSYFMFFKTDKLVCGLQDYSNEQYILDESMIIKFKGNKMTDAKLSQVLTFTEDNLDKKDSYLEELKNQYQGLGFNVSFVENEDGFQIDMNFTKSELESWYGTSLKNSSKQQMKKEMRDSGYTCK